jgi:hypothetical protein
MFYCLLFSTFVFPFPVFRSPIKKRAANLQQMIKEELINQQPSVS